MYYLNLFYTKRVLVLLFTVSFIFSVNVKAENFAVPNGLRPRVDFWKDIFATYGKYQAVVHHRMFPQVVFDIVDVSGDSDSLGPIALANLKETAEKQAVNRVKSAIVNLASGKNAETSMEISIENSMKFLGKGVSKYQKILDEDLIRTQTGIKERYEEAVKRSGRYLPMMEDIFRDYGIPIELTRIPFIESSFDYTAYSSVGAAGIWQFMKGTAKSYMTVNDTVDERRDPLIATRAAAQYLRRAYSVLGSWGLAITSYNHGVAGVKKKVSAFGTSDIVSIIEHPFDRPFGFASNNCYPEFLAAVEIYRDPKKYFPNIQVEPSLKFVERNISRSMSAVEAARTYSVSVEGLKKVNYALSDSVWSGRRSIPTYYRLRVPVGEMPTLEPEEVKDVSVVYSNHLSHIVRKGETLRSIAIKYSTTEKSLMEHNGLKSKIIKVGQEIMLQPGDQIPEKKVKMESKKKESINKSVVKEFVSKKVKKPTVYSVKKGDTLGAIANKNGLTVEKLKKLNKMKGTEIKPGQKLVVR